jgi:hypothetical protein
LPIRWGTDGELEVELPGIDGRWFISVAISLGSPPKVTPDDSPAVLYGDLEVPLHRTDLRDREFDLVSERFRSGGPGEREARIARLPRLRLSRLKVYAYVWSPPGGPAPASGQES